MIAQQQASYEKFLETALLHGSWSNGANWSFHLTEKLPPRELVSGAFCITFCPSGVVLTVTKRGHYEHLGGHLEVGEDVEEAMLREVLEEGGVKLKAFKLMAVRKIDNSIGVINKHTNRPYPKTAYIPFYVGITDEQPGKPTGIEVEEVRVFSPKEAIELPAEKFHEKEELKIALKFLPANLFPRDFR